MRRCWFYEKDFPWTPFHDDPCHGFDWIRTCWNMPKYTSLRSDERSTPKGWSRGATKIGPVLQVKVAYHLDQYGIRSNIDSMQEDGSQSWIVISRRMNKYVNDLPEENVKSLHYEEVTTGTGTPVATRLKEQSTPPLSSLSTIVLRIDRWKW